MGELKSHLQTKETNLVPCALSCSLTSERYHPLLSPSPLLVEGFPSIAGHHSTQYQHWDPEGTENIIILELNQ